MKHLSVVFTILLFIPVMMKHKKLKLTYDVFVMTVKNSFQIFLSMIGITTAFVFVGYMLFRESDHFSGIIVTSISIFSLMSGDSILDLLVDLSEYKMIGFIYIFSVVVFFVFFF